MKNFSSLSATTFLILSLIVTSSVSAAPLPQRITRAVEESFQNPVPTKQMEKFILDVMKTWNKNGIVLTKDDLLAAAQGDFRTLCTKKKDVNGNDITFAVGGSLEGGSCLGLASDLLILMERQRDIQMLGEDLLILSSASELAVTEDVGRPLNISSTAQVLGAVWSGNRVTTGTPLPSSLDPLIDSLETALENQEDITLTLKRFHAGVLRDTRERDSRLSSTGNDVGTILRSIATLLDIDGEDQRNNTPIGIHVFQDLGITLWIRSDDVGITSIFPLNFRFLTLAVVDSYPQLTTNHNTVHYPFNYNDTPTEESLFSPLCATTTGSGGLLCRKQRTIEAICDTSEAQDDITLIECDDENPPKTADELCKEEAIFKQDTGTDIVNRDAFDALPSQSLKELCTPENATLYPKNILSHTCFAATCLNQAWSGHTLIPGRNTVTVTETSSPFLACMREDPHLALSAELPPSASLRIPPYQGLTLVREVEMLYCSLQGDAPHPLLGYCAPSDDIAHKHSILPLDLTRMLTKEMGYGSERRQSLLGTFAAIGMYASNEQSSVVHGMLLRGFASVIDQTASLLEELMSAPLTKTPCPWTGDFSSSSSSASS